MRFILIPLIVSVAMLSACGGSEPHPKAASSAPAVPVQMATVSTQQWPDVYEATGTVRARMATVLSSKLMAYVRQVAVQVGDRVHDGQLLITLDAQDLDTKVSAAEAAEAEVMSAILEADNGVAGAKANLDLAQSTFKRMEELASKKSISNQEFDEASARLKSAQAAYEMARAKRAQLDSKRASGTAGNSRRQDYARLHADFGAVFWGGDREVRGAGEPGRSRRSSSHDRAGRRLSAGGIGG